MKKGKEHKLMGGESTSGASKKDVGGKKVTME